MKTTSKLTFPVLHTTRHPTLIVWDSYLSLQKEYVRLCKWVL